MVCSRCGQPYWRCTCPEDQKEMIRCPFCAGSGVTKGKKGVIFRERPQVCPKCGGSGFIKREFVI